MSSLVKMHLHTENQFPRLPRNSLIVISSGGALVAVLFRVLGWVVANDQPVSQVCKYLFKDCKDTINMPPQVISSTEDNI